MEDLPGSPESCSGEDERTDMDSSSEHQERDEPRSPAYRVSLGSLMNTPAESPGSGARLDYTRSREHILTTPGQQHQDDQEDDEQMSKSSPSWFHARHIPHDQNEILSWHPNRVRATLVVELETRLQHISPRRMRKKTFEPLRAFHSLVHGTGICDENRISFKHRLHARDLYFRVLCLITNKKIREVKDSHAPIWGTTTQEDKNHWYLLRRVMEHPRLANHLKFPVLSKTKQFSSAVQDEKTVTPRTTSWQGYGFVLSYNTDLGQEDPDVIKLVQSGKTGQDFLKAMRSMTLYNEAFTDLWEHANKIAASKNFGTVNVAMEHSTNGDHEARVHFHVFIGPDLRGGVGFGWAPVLAEVKSEELRWRGILPNVKPSRPQKKSWNLIYQTVATGSYYVAGPKIGSIMKRSTFQPIEDSTPCNRTVKFWRNAAFIFMTLFARLLFSFTMTFHV